MGKIRFSILLFIVVAIGILHFVTPGHLHFYHDTYRRLSYFPIVLGAIWFGIRGGLSLAILSSIAFIPHVVLYFGEGAQAYLSELTEIVLYMAAGVVTGGIAGREARLRESYKNLSEKLEKSYARLHEQTEVLLEAEEQLGKSQKLSALGQLSASLAHEIKNPLGSIRGAAEILLDEFPEGHPKREFAAILLKEAERLDGTVEHVLQFARPGSPVEGGTKEPLARVIGRVEKLLQPQFKKKGVVMEMIGLSTGETILVDGDRLAQVFFNILLNALDAVAEREGFIAVHIRKADQGVAIRISDNGPGIAAEDRERIFEPFFSRKEDGTGLGLSISRKIVESYGGSITVSEAPGGGACFTTYLPDDRETLIPIET